MTHGAGDSQGQNLETSALSAMHLIETRVRPRNWSFPRRHLANAFPFGWPRPESELAKHQAPHYSEPALAQRQIKRLRGHQKSYVRDTLPNVPHQRLDATRLAHYR
jgi:hypothetical protein